MKITEIHTVPMPPVLAPKPKVDPSQTPQTSAPPKCMASLQPDGAIKVAFLIEPDVASRIRRRSGSMDLSKYLWENILNRAVTDHVF